MTPSGLSVIFRTYSDIEANVVQALLDSQGRSRPPGAALRHLPLQREPDGRDAHLRARRGCGGGAAIIDSHREVTTGRVMPLTLEFEALESRLGYRFRDCGLLEHGLTHKSKAHEDPSGGVSTTSRWSFLATRFSAWSCPKRCFARFPRIPRARSRRSKRTWCRRRRWPRWRSVSDSVNT